MAAEPGVRETGAVLRKGIFFKTKICIFQPCIKIVQKESNLFYRQPAAEFSKTLQIPAYPQYWPVQTSPSPEPSKKRKNHVEMKEIDPGTEHSYGSLNIVVTGYDVTLVEHYAQYVHRLCNKLSIRVVESYALPTKTMELMVAGEQDNKMRVDAVLTSHQRVVQIKQLSAAFSPIFLEIIQNNLPEGVHLLVKEHTEEDFRIRLKIRTELDELRARLQ